MKKSIIVLDGFYTDPYKVRAHALLSDFNVKGNYPGSRTTPFLNDGIYNAIQHLVQSPIGYWPMDEYNGSFQYTTESDKTWIHADYTTTWAGVLYLTPNAPPEAGTAFYRHIPTGCYECPADHSIQEKCNNDAGIFEQWQCIDRVANVFNRLILFDANRYHASAGFFGNSKENGRLFQTFFFSTFQ